VCQCLCVGDAHVFKLCVRSGARLPLFSLHGHTCDCISSRVVLRPLATRFSTISIPMKPPPTTTADLALRSSIQDFTALLHVQETIRVHEAS